MQKSKQKYHISMEKYNIKKGLIVYTCIVLVFGGCIQAINDKYIKELSKQAVIKPFIIKFLLKDWVFNKNILNPQ